ncbi:MAG TPA: ABC transporter ATP-binding protein [Anaerolineales bacterium]|nr:ABC transporter ATP-binding protein [Anaerolineales bacterium]
MTYTSISSRKPSDTSILSGAATVPSSPANPIPAQAKDAADDGSTLRLRKASAQGAPVIRTESLSRTYRMGNAEVHAVRNVSLTVQRGEFIALMGTSGSGKSTLMHLLGCLDTPNAGNYWLEGKDVARLSTRARADIRNRHIGFIFQNFNLLPRLSAMDNVTLPLMYANANGMRKRASEAIARVGLASRANHRPNELSGGERQRVAIARALVTAPALILADEPTGNLDSKTGLEIMHLLTDLHREGRTILIVTHDANVAGFAERVIVMQDGGIISNE